MRNLMYIVQDLMLLKKGQTLHVAIMANAKNTCEPRRMVGMISMHKEFNETYGDHIRAHHARIVDGAESTTDDHVWSGCEVDAVMTMDITYRGNCKHTRLETYTIEE